MSAVTAAIDQVTPSKKTLGNGFKILMTILAVGFVAAFLYWFFFLKRLSWKEVKRLISLESGKYPGKEVPTEHILMQGAQEIVSHPHLAKQAMEFSKSSGIAIERVIVDNAIAMAKNLGYIPANTTIISPPPAPNQNSAV
jgi:hypothetical protein